MRCKDLDKQKRIKDAVVELILMEGIDGMSISKIAKRAEVSPATIYVYYNSKEDMLAEVYQEYSGRSYDYLLSKIWPEMSAGELIEAIVRGYYDYSYEHEEVFSFVEQCSRCPTIAGHVSEEACCCDVFDAIHAYQNRGEMIRCSDMALGAILFAPVKFLAVNRQTDQIDDRLLEELIQMIKGALLI